MKDAMEDEREGMGEKSQLLDVCVACVGWGSAEK